MEDSGVQPSSLEEVTQQIFMVMRARWYILELEGFIGVYQRLEEPFHSHLEPNRRL